MFEKIKGARKSLTIWFNGLTLAAITLIDLIQPAIPQLQGYVTPEVFKAVGLTVLILNIALRFKTSESLKDK